VVHLFDLRHAAALTISALDEHGVNAALSYVSVARLEEIPTDRGLRVVVDGIWIGLYRVDETVYAMEDTCPHAGYPLSEGELDGCVISCRAHGWPFDIRTGFDPEHADGFPIPCFAVEVDGNQVRIDLADRINEPRRRSRGPNGP
jgi:nitrite reductase/ring-hydroxylating ferredoxin subunit